MDSIRDHYGLWPGLLLVLTPFARLHSSVDTQRIRRGSWAVEKALHILTIVSFGLFLAIWAQQALVQTMMLFRHRSSVMDMNARRAEILVFLMAVLTGVAALGLIWFAEMRGVKVSVTLVSALAGVTLVTFVSWAVMRRHRRSVSIFNLRPRDFQFEAQGFFNSQGIEPRIGNRRIQVPGGAALETALFPAAHSVRLDPGRDVPLFEARALARELAAHVRERAPKHVSMTHLLLIGKMYVMAGVSLAFMVTAARAFEMSLL